MYVYTTRKSAGKDVIRIRYIHRANKYITCLQNIFIRRLHLKICNFHKHPMCKDSYTATEYILKHRRRFLSIGQQRTICTSMYKQYEDFDLMYLIKLGIDKYFKIVLV